MANTSDVLGAIFVGILFFGTVTIWIVGRRKIEKILRSEADTLKAKGFDISSSGMSVQTKLDLTREDLVQRTSHKVQKIKDRLEHSPELVHFGQKKGL
ncbi:hypothetical protein DFH28DRAFT_393708 [Melampsora americana]|nr:hypothetical protein DFH28DRAFT_393708 [Melampsora americana]